jgi:UDP-2-acetamido-3-amino-2,3-dideoxy-glucuronate N-acetyltransferase
LTSSFKPISDTGNLSVAIMGTGKWGRNLVRVFDRLEGVELRWIVDPDEEALTKAHRVAPTASRATHISSVVDQVQLVAVCTPARNHNDHVRTLLKYGKHVLVEKPFTMDTDDAIALANASNTTLMVGHQLLYHPAFTKLKSLVSRGALGALRRIKTERTGTMDLGREPGVLWSYGPHDVSMILALTDQEPAGIFACGRVPGPDVDTALAAQIHLAFPSGVGAEITLSTLHPKRTRRLIAICEHGTLVFDDGKPGGRLFLLDGPLESLSTQEIHIENEEALATECAHFVDCIRSGKTPLTGPKHAVAVTRIIDMAASRMQADWVKPISYPY